MPHTATGVAAAVPFLLPSCPQRFSRNERAVRIDLAAAYRFAALAGWDDTVYTHLSAAVPGQPGVYLINEFGLGFDEITASSLVKVNLRGEVVDLSQAHLEALKMLSQPATVLCTTSDKAAGDTDT